METDEAKPEEKNHLEIQHKTHVFMDFTFNDVKVGRVIIELYENLVPKSVENFRALCTGEKGIGKHGKPLHYKGTRIHRVVPLCFVQGGDVVNNDGSGGESIYGDVFPDENLELKHDAEGYVGMSNNGADKNGSQFYITTVSCPQLDDTHVIIGRVVKGLNIIVEMQDIPRVNDLPTQNIIISDCGEIKHGQPWEYAENDGVDVYPPWPNDWEVDPRKHETIKTALHDISTTGKQYFRKHKWLEAEKKYKKILRYIDWYILENENSTDVTKKVSEMRNRALLNLTAARLKVNKNREALSHCDEVLKNSPKNAKAFYRRAKARLALNDYDEALKDLKMALELHPDDVQIRHVLDKTKQIKLKYLKMEKQFCSKVFG